MTIFVQKLHNSVPLKPEDPLVHLMIYTFFLDLFLLQHLCYSIVVQEKCTLWVKDRPSVLFLKI